MIGMAEIIIREIEENDLEKEFLESLDFLRKASNIDKNKAYDILKKIKYSVIEKENNLGEEGNGFPQHMNSFEATRTDVAAQAIGISKSCLKICREYSSVRTQFNPAFD